MQNLDHALDDQINDPAVISGDAADHHAQQETQRNADQPDRQGNPRAVNHARQDVPAEAVGSQEKQRTALFNAEKVQVAIEITPEFIRVSPTEELNPVNLRRVFLIFPAQRGEVQRKAISIHERPDELALVEHVQGLRRRVDGVDIPGM